MWFEGCTTELELNMEVKKMHSKEYMNGLVMDYLVSKGYRDVADTFWKDSGFAPNVDLKSVQERVEVRSAIQRGDVRQARTNLLRIDDRFLEEHPRVAFILVKQELIELIKTKKISEALVFATTNLACFGEKNSDCLQEIEQTMALLAFENPGESPLGFLLDQSQRRQVADEVNTFILRVQKQEFEPLLPSFVRHFQFLEDELHEQTQRIPGGIAQFKVVA